MIELKRATGLQCLLRWRAEVIRHVFGVEPDSTLMDANREYYYANVPAGMHEAFIAEYDGEECGCGAICFSTELPSPDNHTGLCAYLMNIYVREPFRNKGIAHRIVSRLIAEARKRGCGKIYLETTADGKPVYSSLGFRDMPDMMKYYDEDA